MMTELSQCLPVSMGRSTPWAQFGTVRPINTDIPKIAMFLPDDMFVT